MQNELNLWGVRSLLATIIFMTASQAQSDADDKPPVKYDFDRVQFIGNNGLPVGTVYQDDAGSFFQCLVVSNSPAEYRVKRIPYRAKVSPFAVTVPDDKPPKKSVSLNNFVDGDAEIVGLLGIPLGTTCRVKGVVVNDRMSKTSDSEVNALKVLSVDGELVRGVVVPLQRTSANNLRKLAVGDEWAGVVYETGANVGYESLINKWTLKNHVGPYTPNLLNAQRPFGFQTFLVVWEKSKVPRILDESGNAKPR